MLHLNDANNVRNTIPVGVGEAEEDSMAGMLSVNETQLNLSTSLITHYFSL